MITNPFMLLKNIYYREKKIYYRDLYLSFIDNHIFRYEELEFGENMKLIIDREDIDNNLIFIYLYVNEDLDDVAIIKHERFIIDRFSGPNYKLTEKMMSKFNGFINLTERRYSL